MRQALVRLGFSNEAASDVTNIQGIDNAGELVILSDEEIENLCRIIRKPGGQIEIAGDGNDVEQVPNPGNAVPLRAENNLKLARYWLLHQQRTSNWPVQLNSITLENVRSLKPLRDTELAYKRPEDKAPRMNERNWPKTLESVSEYLKTILGIKGVPLAYVVREDREIADDDPTWTHAQRMINRAPHFTAEGSDTVTEEYRTDNESVWKEIAEMTRDHKCWTYVKPFQKNLDGRGAFRGLWDHYLGPSNVDHLAAAAESKLETARYTGEKKRYNFESYVRLHKDQHQILGDLKQHGYAGIDDRSKVRHLMSGIKVTHLDTVKSRILSESELRTNFDRCVTLYQDFIKQSKATENVVNISKVQTDKKRGIKEVQDRYYTPQEYGQLSQEQKLKLKGLRDARGGKKQKTGDGPEPTKESLKRRIAALQAKLEEKPDGGSKEEKSACSDCSNKDHPALTRTRQSTKTE